MRALLLLVCVILGGFATAGGGAVGGPAGHIQGVVFHDLDSDGILEDADAALGGRTVTLKQGDAVILTATSIDSPQGLAGGGGAFSMTAVPVGDYRLEVELDVQGPPLCIDSFGSFDPFRVGGCFVTFKQYFAPTTPESMAVTVTDGGTATANFGGSQIDIYFDNGIAILNDDYAPIGAPIEAYLGDAACGTSEITQAGGTGAYTFSIDLMGDAAGEGCPGAGQLWHFRVGGVEASETLVSDSDQSFDRLTAMPDHAWYWVEGPLGTDHAGVGAIVQAHMGSVLCGEATVSAMDRGFGEEVLGFTRLIVPSDALQAGCGQPGATVSFSIGGGPATDVIWETGVHRLAMALPGQVALGDSDCDGSRDATDALLTLRLVAGLIFGPVEGCPFVFDVNCDGEVDSVDALIILRFAAALPTSIPVFCPVFPVGGI